MKILITGHKGFIGSHLHKLLPEADGLSIRNGGQEDIRNCKLDKEYTHIFHLAALRSAPMGEEHPEDFISTNCWGTVRLLKRYPNARIINVTSASAENVKGVYGATKKFCEIYGSIYPNVVNVRPYNVFGEGQTLESTAAMPKFITAFIKGERPVVYGNGFQIRDFTYVKDLAHELKRIMFESKENKLYHCGYHKPMSVIELLTFIWGKLPDIDFQPARSVDIFESIAPYGMKEHFGREEGLKRTIEWWKNAIPISAIKN